MHRAKLPHASCCKSFSQLGVILIITIICPSAVGAAGPDRHTVGAVRNIPYCRIPDDPDDYRHRLDVYAPKEKGTYPVLFLVHGGAWVIGSKDNVAGIFGYSTIGKCLAARGLVVVVPNYRLSPSARHPDHIEDVARAFAWTHRHAREFGGDTDRLFVAGHSAGGHLVSLLTMAPQYLKKHGLTNKCIRGVISMSGVYRLSEFDVEVALPANIEVLPARFKVQPLAQIFGTDTRVIERASPINHVRPGLPPFLIISATRDYAPMRRMALEFAIALKKAHCIAEHHELPGRTHETILFDIPHLTMEAATANLIGDFINTYSSSPIRDTLRRASDVRQARYMGN